MARKPVGYKSPFRKASPAKIAPWLMAAGKWAISPGGQAAIAAAAPGVIGAVGSLFGRSKRRKEQAIARKEMEAAKKAYMDMEFKNPLEGLQNPYQENLYEDLTVDTQAADYLKQQQQQSQANIMQQMKGVAGSSGIAGLAQSMANVSSQQAQRASVGLAQQERQNQMLALKGEQQKRKGAFDIDYKTRMGEQKYVTAMEQQRTAAEYGLGLDRLSAADTARSTARSGVIKGLGQAVAGVGGTFMPGGANYGAFSGGGGGGTPFNPQTYLQQPEQYTMDPNQLINRPIVTEDPNAGGLDLTGNTSSSYNWNPWDPNR